MKKIEVSIDGRPVDAELHSERDDEMRNIRTRLDDIKAELKAAEKLKSDCLLAKEDGLTESRETGDRAN